MGFIRTVVKVLLIMYIFEGFSIGERSVDYSGHYADEVTAQFIDEVQRSTHLSCHSSGGSMPFDILSIKVSFVADKYGTVEEARELLVDLINKFANIINAHKKIRPFLREYPFPPNRIHVSVGFEPRCKPADSFSEVDYASCIKGTIFYSQDAGARYVTIKEEPYEEARSIVQRSQI